MGVNLNGDLPCELCCCQTFRLTYYGGKCLVTNIGWKTSVCREDRGQAVALWSPNHYIKRAFVKIFDKKFFDVRKIFKECLGVIQMGQIALKCF